MRSSCSSLPCRDAVSAAEPYGSALGGGGGPACVVCVGCAPVASTPTPTPTPPPLPIPPQRHFPQLRLQEVVLSLLSTKRDIFILINPASLASTQGYITLESRYGVMITHGNHYKIYYENKTQQWNHGQMYSTHRAVLSGLDRRQPLGSKKVTSLGRGRVLTFTSDATHLLLNARL